jgi:two-component system, OmpR family, sensor histidine kinase AdeS
MKLAGLNRQIILSMAVIAVSVTLLVFVTSYAFYYLWSLYWPEPSADESWALRWPDWLWMIASLLVGLALAVVQAVKLSRRILLPLNSVADSIRRVRQGDLSARAVTGDPSMSEAWLLAEDFNALTSQLQRMTGEQAFWNAAIAHELRTPVTILRGRLQGLAEGVFTPDESQFRNLLVQIEGLARLIEDLRAVSLAESGHLDIQIKEVDLAAEIKDIADLLSDGFRAAGQNLVLDLDSRPVYCDAGRIRQALLALLENARRYALAGQIRICSRIEDGCFRLTVEDSGPGIPESFCPHVFTAFRRAENSRSGGSGLGLAVVAAIARAHGGTAECGTSSSGGTAFTLTWPDTPEPLRLNSLHQTSIEHQ